MLSFHIILFRVLLVLRCQKIVLYILSKIFNLFFILIKSTCLQSCFNRLATCILKSSRKSLSPNRQILYCSFLVNCLILNFGKSFIFLDLKTNKTTSLSWINYVHKIYSDKIIWSLSWFPEYNFVRIYHF